MTLKKYFLAIFAVVAFFTTTALGCGDPTPTPTTTTTAAPTTTTVAPTTTTTVPPVLTCVGFVRPTYTVTINDALGADPTIAHVSKPLFTLNGNGGASKYAVTIDGVSIGTFNGDGHGIVCIQGATPLADGVHTLRATELTPNPAAAAVLFKFSIDTVAPVVPIITSATVSGTSVRIAGTSVGADSVRVFEGPGLKGGSDASTGTWSVAILSLSIGTHTFTAASVDEAGNISPRTAPLTITVS